MKLKDLRRSLFTMTFGIMLGRVLGFFQSILIARMLGPTSLGKYATLIMICALVSRAADFGLPHATVYFLRRSPQSMASLLRTVLLHGFASAAIAGLCTWGIRYLPLPIAGDIQSSPGLQICLFGFMMIGTIVNILPLFLMATASYRGYVAFFNIGTALQIALQYGMVFLKGPSFQGFFAANAIGQSIMAFLLILYLLKRTRSFGTPVSIGRSSVYSYGLKAHWGVIMKIANNQLEVPVISSVIHPGLVGQYSVGATLREATLMPQSFYAGILQNMLVDKNRNKDAGGGRLILKSMVLQFFLSLVIALGALVVLPFAIPLIYGKGFEYAASIAVILVFGTIFSGLSSLCWTDFHAKGRPQITSAAQTLSGLLGPCLLLAVAAKFGLIGAGIASVFTNFVTFCISIYFVCRLNHFRLKDIGLSVVEAYAFALSMLTWRKPARPGSGLAPSLPAPVPD